MFLIVCGEMNILRRLWNKSSPLNHRHTILNKNEQYNVLRVCSATEGPHSNPNVGGRASVESRCAGSLWTLAVTTYLMLIVQYIFAGISRTRVFVFFKWPFSMSVAFRNIGNAFFIVTSSLQFEVWHMHQIIRAELSCIYSDSCMQYKLRKAYWCEC